MAKIKIAIDTGHGINTAGKRTPAMPYDIDFEGDGIIDVKKGTSLKEHVANVGVAVRLEKEFMRNGFEIYRSGWNDGNPKDDTDDLNVELRKPAIKKAKCDYSVSIHFNASGGNGQKFDSAEGVSTYIHKRPERVADSRKLAECVQKRLLEGTKQKNRGVLEDGFALCNCADMGTKASILVELAFMTNEKEATTMMGSAAFWQESAEDICKGFCDYLGKKYIPDNEPEAEIEQSTKKTAYYRVRKAWKDEKSQLGAYKNLGNAKKIADANQGFFVFDNEGNKIYPEEATFAPYEVKINISNLNIRTGPGTNYSKVGRYTGKGVFTIVDEDDGAGAGKWGLLKSYASKRNGWISLDFAEKL